MLDVVGGVAEVSGAGAVLDEDVVSARSVEALPVQVVVLDVAATSDDPRLPVDFLDVFSAHHWLGVWKVLQGLEETAVDFP